MKQHLLVWALAVAALSLLVSTRGAAATCGERSGAIRRDSLRSAAAETTFYYSVYTPPCYDQNTSTYPVLYLMHGSNEDDGQWGRLGIQPLLDDGIAAGTLPPMIVVMPFGEWLANRNQFEGVSWEGVFLDELLPHIEAQYRVDGRRETRMIGGISRGGFWALEIAFRHPDLFSAVGGHSAFLDDYNAPPEYNPLRVAQTSAEISQLRIWLDRGKDDFAAPGLDLLDERLTERGLTYQYTVYPEGQHAPEYWRQHVGEYLAFYGASLQTASAAPTPPPMLFVTNTPQATPAPSTPTPSGAKAEGGFDLFLPAVAFPSLLTSVDGGLLAGLRDGQAAPKLALDTTTAAALTAHGLTLPASTEIVADDALMNVLWRDRTRFTLLAFDRLTTRVRVLNVDGQDVLYERLADYPLAFPAAQPNYRPDHLTRVLLSGVTALTRLTREALNKNGVAWAAEAIAPYTQRADFFHTSNEVSFSPTCPQPDGVQLGEFCAKEAHFDILKLLGLDIVELTGNHNNDFGTDNTLKTLAWYSDNGIATLGGGSNLEAARTPLQLEHHHNRIVMLACNAVGPYYAIADADAPGAADCDWNWLRETLPALAAASDVLVVTVQYTEVEDYRPLPQQELDFRGLADLGADVVIGTQAHKPQTFEFYGSSFIHYGIGNFLFDQPFWGNMRFFMDDLWIYEGRLLTVGLFTGIIDDNARPRPMTADEQMNFLAFMFNQQNGF
jgi:enterochelin esterase-like enzyme